ncbi:MAG: MFS transporter [Spirochaetales bacterium]|nr:MFS transporter [Spirochaetales bacterium]
MPGTVHTQNPWQRNIVLLTIIKINFSMIFAIAVIASYWKEHGLSLFDIFLLQAIFSFSVVLFEIPTGYIGDRLGRKRTILLAAAINVVGWIIYSSFRFFWGFVAAEITLGLSLAFLSGTDSAVIFESLKELKRQGDYSKVLGRINGLFHLGAAFSSITGGICAMFFPVWWLMLATGSIALASFSLAFFITEPTYEVYKHHRGTVYGFYKIFRYVFLRSKIVRAALPLLAACSLATMLGVWLYQPFWTAREVPIWLFGILWACLFIPSGLGSHFAHKAENILGRRGIIFMLPLPPLIGYVLAGILPGYWALIPIYFVNILYGLAPPLLGKYIQEETFSDKRATVMSIGSFLFRISYCLLAPLVGFIANRLRIETAFFAIAGISSLLIIIFIPFFLEKLKLWEAAHSESARMIGKNKVTKQ